uniref:DH domain-containing protein n=2 Tax=Clastoptera arizonana TaxID=38151 RepID=A0A1B6CR30_9HEMI
MEEPYDNSIENKIKQTKSVDVSDLDEDNSKEGSPPAVQTTICLVGNCSTDAEVLVAAQGFGFPVVLSEDGSEWLDTTQSQTVFVMDEFSGPIFEKLRKLGHRLLGTTVIKELHERNESIPNNKRPLYSLAMSGLVICFTGFRKKEELARLIVLTHNMGGSIRKDMAGTVTHLIAHKCMGEKYQYALAFSLPVMAASWVHNTWAMRAQVGYSAADPNNNSADKLKLFQGARVCFYGFPEEEEKHMADVLVENGGIHTDIDDPACSHLVVDVSPTVTSVPQAPSKSTHIVKAEWFWATVQNEALVPEKQYLFEDHLESLVSPNRNDSDVSLTMSGRRRKRKRFFDTTPRVVSGYNVTPVVSKRRSSVSDAGLLSMSGSFLDCTPSSGGHLSDTEIESINSDTPRKEYGRRYEGFLELYHTETNYVNILNTIMTLFKTPLETKSEEKKEPLLNPTELKIIFGNFSPIYQLHCKMLEKLKWVANHWTDDVSIGKIIVEFAPDLVKAYPPYINFFETTKEMLVMCDQTKPRFHAFLKICQSKPECGRQTLQELLIRPVQRLPSISILLNDLLVHTDKTNPDHSALDQALSKIREVMTHINEDKRRTEGQMAIFDIFNNIEQCPPYIVSSHRNFVSRCDVIELSDGLRRKGDSLSMFLFSDVMEICKKRSKVFDTLKSPRDATAIKLNAPKPFKHIHLMPLSHIKKVIDIKETDDCHKSFALICKSNQDLREERYLFKMVDEDKDKIIFLKTLCRQMANTVCIADAETFLTSLEPQQLDIDTSDVTLGTLGKAIKMAARTRMKVGRAFSFNKTPNKLRRVVSTMMSPFGSTSSLTPATQLEQMRLAADGDRASLNEFATSTNANGSPPAPQYIAPMSVQPMRRNKHASLSVASLRRL